MVINDNPLLGINLSDLCNGVLEVNDYGHNLLLKYNDLIDKMTW